MLKSDRYVKYLLLVPATATLALVLVYPTVITIKYSISLPRSSAFQFSAANYIRLFGDRVFWHSLSNTVLLAGSSVFAHLILGLGVALILNTRIKGQGTFRVVAVLPWAIPVVVSGITWRWIYHPISGILNDVLFRVGLIDQPILWLSSPSVVLYSVVFANIWRGFPFAMIILLAGLQSIPAEGYDAASIDGAGRFHRFVYITLPSLKKSIIVALAWGTVSEFRRFELIQVMTGGGPGTMSDVFSTTIYKLYFQFFRFEYASAMAILMSVVLLFISIPYIKGMLEE